MSSSDKVHVHDLQATILHLLGLDHEKLTYRFQGRDFRLTDVHGSVVQGAAGVRREPQALECGSLLPLCVRSLLRCHQSVSPAGWRTKAAAGCAQSKVLRTLFDEPSPESPCVAP